MSYHIEVATLENGGLQFIFDNAKREGWEPGVDDLSIFPTADPNGFFVGILDGKIVGCVSAVRHDDSYGFIGYYIVSPEYRGNTYGLQLFQHGMRYLGDRNIGLDGLLVQVPNYQRSGFNSFYTTSRYQGTGIEDSSDLACPNIVPLSNVDIETLAQYDSKFFPTARNAWISNWISGNIQNLSSAVYLENGEILGYGVIRPCISGYRIGPLYANSSDVAKSLLTYLRAKVSPGSIIYIDVPNVNANAVALMDQGDIAFTKLWDCIRMYTKTEPNVNNDGVYGASSLELG
jgi:hypothetical protein